MGRQHHVGLEVEGVTYDLLLGNEEEAIEEARKRTAAAAAATAAATAASHVLVPLPPGTALPASPTHTHSSVLANSHGGFLPAAASDGAVGEVAPLQLFSGPRSSRTLELPETTLTGPLELVLKKPEPVAIYSPLAADVGGPVRRVVVEPGVTVRVAGLRRVSLRRPLDLPRLPGQYLAEVYAQSMTGQAEEGFDSSPGIMYLAAQLRQAALEVANGTHVSQSRSTGGRSSSSKSSKKGRSRTEGDSGAHGAEQPAAPLLSFDVETVSSGSLTIASAPELPPGVASGAAAAPPRLKVRRQAGGTVELSLRQGQVFPADGSFNPAALSRAWAWPLPHAASSSWLPYETLLRSVLASHPFNIDSVISRGIGLRLTKSSIQGVHMIAFDMEVRSRQPRPEGMEELPFEWNETPLEVWEAVVRVDSVPPAEAAGGSGASGASSGGGGYRFVPLHVKRKQSYQNTITMSRSAVIAALTGGQNSTEPPYGYDQLDLGIAANAP